VTHPILARNSKKLQLIQGMAQKVIGVYIGQGSGSLSYTASPPTSGSATFKPIILDIGELLTNQNLTRDRAFFAASRESHVYGEVRIRLGF